MVLLTVEYIGGRGRAARLVLHVGVLPHHPRHQARQIQRLALFHFFGGVSGCKPEGELAIVEGLSRARKPIHLALAKILLKAGGARLRECEASQPRAQRLSAAQHAAEDHRRQRRGENLGFKGLRVRV